MKGDSAINKLGQAIVVLVVVSMSVFLYLQEPFKPTKPSTPTTELYLGFTGVKKGKMVPLCVNRDMGYRLVPKYTGCFIWETTSTYKKPRIVHAILIARNPQNGREYYTSAGPTKDSKYG